MTETKGTYSADVVQKELVDNLIILARARSGQERAKAKMKQMLAVVQASEEFMTLARIADQCAIDGEAATNVIKALAKETGITHPAIGRRKRIVFDYDLEKTRAWCIANLPGSVSIDWSYLEKHALAVRKTSPLEWVTITDVETITIAQDLAKHLGPIIASDDSEIPF